MHDRIRAPHRAAHLELIKKNVDRGKILMAGALADPPDKAYFVCTTKQAAEQFVEKDPYIANGVVVGSQVREWSVVNFGESEMD